MSPRDAEKVRAKNKAWRERHPEQARQQDRQKAARRSRAEAALREAHRGVYDALMSTTEGSWEVRNRAAIKTLRFRYAADWVEFLAAERES